MIRGELSPAWVNEIDEISITTPPNPDVEENHLREPHNQVLMSHPSHAWRSQRLVFKGVEESDDDFLFEMRSDSAVYLNAAPHLPTPATKEHATKYREFMQKCTLGVIICLPSPAPSSTSSSSTEAAKPPSVNAAPFQPRRQKETLIPIGDLNLRADPNPLMSHHRSVDIGISIHCDYQGQGYGSEAIRWVLEWSFRRANLHRVGIAHFAWNEGAGRLYQRVSMCLQSSRDESLMLEENVR
jgi:hypothetical protein